MKNALKFRAIFKLLVLALVVSAFNSASTLVNQESPETQTQTSKTEETMLVQYLEIVTADVDATCAALEKIHGISFGEPEAVLGNARTARLKSGGRIGVRAPMREDEDPVVRPYLLVDDIAAAVKAAEAGGGEFAMYPTEIPGHGKFAIYFQGGIQYGLWEL